MRSSVETEEESATPSTEEERAEESGDQPIAQSTEEASAETEQAIEPSTEEASAETEQATEQSTEEASAETEQATEQSVTEAAPEGDQPTEQAGDQPAEAEAQAAPSEGSAEESAAPTTEAGELNAKRQNMLDLINKWMPTSLNNPRVPDGESQDLLAKAGWNKTTGQTNKKLKDDGKAFATSCGDVLSTLLRLWKSNFVGAFNIRDTDSNNHKPGAKGLGYYVDADKLEMDGDVVTSPKPGDILVLRNGAGAASAGSVGHVGILIEATKTKWKTADGGGGQLPDQTAQVTERDVRWVNNTPILKSPTDLREKQLDGWVDLDKLEQTAGAAASKT
jgi:hypothetical protein